MLRKSMDRAETILFGTPGGSPKTARRSARYSLAPSEGLIHLADFRKRKFDKLEKLDGSTKIIPDTPTDSRALADLRRQLGEANRVIENLQSEKSRVEARNDALERENRDLRAVRQTESTRDSKRAREAAAAAAAATTTTGSDDAEADDKTEVEIKIEGMSKGTTTASLLALVEDHGRVARVRVTRLPLHGETQLNGYCAFKSRANALRCLDALKANGYAASLVGNAAAPPPKKQAKWRS